MTLKEFQNKRDFYYREYKYYSWACCQSSCSPTQDETDKKMRDEYFNKWQKLNKLENKILENGLKSIDKDNY